MCYFNPRPREEGDGYIVPVDKEEKSISIHALVKRATPPEEITKGAALISIHALVKRATMSNCELFIRLLISIHALVKRATDVYQDNACWIIFQSTPS